MRMSKMFGKTLREIPAGCKAPGHGFLLKAGYIRQHAAGIFSLLPPGFRAVRKID